MNPAPDKPSQLQTPLTKWLPNNLETLLVIVLLAIAILSRFIDLGVRTMSHDEINHVVPTFSLYSGNGYRYDPMSHGPIQYHMIALAYALFGDDDFTTRIPAAVLNIATILVALVAFRRYLGRTGALVAGVLIIISPLMLFYARYARNESYIVLWGILTLYSILRYLETGEKWALLLFTLANALHFTDKATAYMFAAEEMLFLGAYFIDRVLRKEWKQGWGKFFFLLGLLLSVLMWAGAYAFYASNKPAADAATSMARSTVIVIGVMAAGGVGTLVWAVIELLRGVGLTTLKGERTADLLILLTTFVLPLCSAFPIKLLGYTVLDYSKAGITRVAIAASLLAVMAAILGLWWFRRRWLLPAALFFIPFILLYSTFLTNPEGLAGGLVGALSYWTDQQAVARGGQPLYYYLFLMIPMYEFLPAVGTITAAGIAATRRLWQSEAGKPFTTPAAEDGKPPVPVAALLVFWSVSSLAVFSYAGEKMPWLTIHLTLPMILATGWAVGWLVETTAWVRFSEWTIRQVARFGLLVLFIILAIQTGRDAFRAAFINYDKPTEYLVYAHAAPLPKELLGIIDEISIRTTGNATDMVVAYDNQVRYPYWWYLRRFPNKIDFDTNPTRDVRRALVIETGDENLSKLTPVVRQDYNEYQGMRLWWPNMDYWNLKWSTIESERNIEWQREHPDNTGSVPSMNIGGYLKYVWPHIKPFFTDPKIRHAVLKIWLEDDFTEWGELRNSTAYTLTDWGVSDRMHYYIRKDITAQLWPYGAPVQETVTTEDPYQAITIPAQPDKVIGAAGTLPGQFQSPRAVAVAADGSLYVVDSMNARIQHLKTDGSVIQTWGSRADISQGTASGGTFNEPWGIAIGPEGSLFVSDTWNHRIQKFSSNGRFITMWGFFGQSADGPDAFYGPRGLVVDPDGRLYVADTGNKRIVIFDEDGNYITQFGTAGMGMGELDEPVAVALDQSGKVYVTDTWNQRVQVFQPDANKLTYTAVAEWLVDGWYGQSVENKPFITVEKSGDVTVTDPELCRLITFNPQGTPIQVKDGCLGGTFVLPSGITSDLAGGVWVTNAGNGTIVHIPGTTASP
jgi:uncharacterized protein (TIGR03663 family)